jgi:hypothetical protein
MNLGFSLPKFHNFFRKKCQFFSLASKKRKEKRDKDVRIVKDFIMNNCKGPPCAINPTAH